MGCPQSGGRTSRWRQLAGLSTAHFVVDGYGSFLSPLISTLAIALGVSYRAVSLLIGLNAVSAAVANIVVGLASDRWKHLGRATIVISAAVTAIFMSAVGVIPNYWLLAAAMFVGMFACGAFHPPAFSLAGEISRPNRHHGVSVVMAVGIGACGLGPILVSQVVKAHGLQVTFLCAVPGLILAAAAAFLLRRVSPAEDHQIDTPQTDRAPAVSRKEKTWLAMLVANMTLRAFAQIGVLVIVSFLAERRWGFDVDASGWGIGVLLAGSGLGILAGARLTRVGRERGTILWCAPVNLLLLVPLALTAGKVWFFWLFLYGLAVNGPSAVVVAMAQGIAPHRSALLSGVLVGPVSAVGTLLASVTTPFLIEKFGQPVTMAFLAVPLALSWLTALFLPKEPGDTAKERSSA